VVTEPDPPKTAPAAGTRNERLVLIGVMALVVIAILGATWYFTRPKVEVGPAPIVTETAPPAAPVLASLIIDARPWAEIVSIKDNAGKEIPAADGAKRYTPMSLLVPPGEYTVTLATPSSSTPQVIAATVKESGGSCEAQFAAVDVNDYFKQAGWK
jgi:hypothetical protein